MLVKAPVSIAGYSKQLEQWKEIPKVLRIRKPIRLKKLLNVMSPPSRKTPANALKRKRPSVRILIAEDNKMNQLIALKMLKSFGFDDIEVVENGKLAVEAAKTGSFDIILMDIMVVFFGNVD